LETTKAFGYQCTKSATGHLLGAAVRSEGIASILAVKNDIIPPTINTQNLDGYSCSLNLTLGKAQRKTVNVAMAIRSALVVTQRTSVFKKLVE